MGSYFSHVPWDPGEACAHVHGRHIRQGRGRHYAPFSSFVSGRAGLERMYRVQWKGLGVG